MYVRKSLIFQLFKNQNISRASVFLVLFYHYYYSDREMSSSSNSVSEEEANLATYSLQLQQVEAALTNDPGNQELLKLKTDLQEIIALTQQLIETTRATSSSSSSSYSTHTPASQDTPHTLYPPGDRKKKSSLDALQDSSSSSKQVWMWHLIPNVVIIIIIINIITKQAGTGPSRRHIQGSKIAKGLPSVNLQYSKIEKPKKWTEWRAGAR